MCNKCLKNLGGKTKTNKCPACREVIIDITEFDLEKEQSLETENENTIFTINYICCECTFNRQYPQTFYQRCKLICNFAQPFFCCIYNYFRIYNHSKIAFLYTFMTHVFFLLIGRILYSQLYNENESEFWCLWYIFIVKSFVGFCIGTFIIIASLCILFCIYDCFCNNDDFD